jgi:hypothetical protein
MKLQDLSLPQAAMLLSPSKIHSIQLLKFSLLELLYHQVLEIVIEWRLPNPRHTTERKYTLVKRGKQFEKEHPTFVNNPFVKPFIGENHLFQLLPFCKKVYAETQKENVFKRTVIYEELRRYKFFKTSLGFKYFDLYFLNRSGAKQRFKLKSMLESAEKNLPILLSSDPKKANEVLQELGPYIFLVENFDSKLFQEIQKVLNQDLNVDRYDSGTYLDLHTLFLDAGFDVLIAGFADLETSFQSIETSFSDSSAFDGLDFGDFDFGGWD